MCDQQRPRPACTCAFASRLNILLTEHHLESLSFKIKQASHARFKIHVPHCWKLHVAALLSKGLELLSAIDKSSSDGRWPIFRTSV